MPVEHEYLVWRAVGLMGPVVHPIKAGSAEDAAAQYAQRYQLAPGRKVRVVRAKHVDTFVSTRVMEKA